ncbi:uncharacterized protein LOC110818803 isoform X2 [Carica papaya]|uniref:uncharacterized protein LOC110818803 isoform X2 n=1 Tax=Carica papaya TaxID=3649 RepID=UPI000B8CA6BA|nr:uncharacterized protein LOC110818803 isoform X2 [Carica papaya]
MFSRIFQQHQQQYISRISPSFSYVSTFSFCFFKYHGSMKTANKTTTTKKVLLHAVDDGRRGHKRSLYCWNRRGTSFQALYSGNQVYNLNLFLLWRCHYHNHYEYFRSVCNIVAGAFSVHHQSIYKPLEDIFDLIELLGEPDFYSAQTVLFSFIHSSSAHALLLESIVLVKGNS